MNSNKSCRAYVSGSCGPF